MARTAKTTSAEVRQRAGAAREHLQVALERVEYGDGTADPSAAAQVAASNAISAGIAATDAICGAVLGERANDQDHRSAVELLSTVEPGGSALAGRLLVAGARPLRAVKTAPARAGTRSRPHVVGRAGASQLTESCCLPSEVT